MAAEPMMNDPEGREAIFGTSREQCEHITWLGHGGWQTASVAAS
jgi:hypothetical protein